MGSRQERHVVVAAWTGAGNLGDELIFIGLREKLWARGARITVVSKNPEESRRERGVAAVGHTNVRGLWEALDTADALVFGGGGVIQDLTSAFNLPYHVSRLWAARARRVPFAVVGVGVGPLTTAFGRRLARASLAPAAGIGVRDEPSAAALEELGLRPTLAADLAVSLPSPAPRQPDRIVACLRPWSTERRRLPVARSGQPTDPAILRALATGLDDIASELGLPVRFVAFEPARDDALHRRVAAMMRAPTEFAKPTLRELRPEIARGYVVVGVRFHAGICALLARRPAVLIGYTPKVDALAADMGDAARLLPWEGLHARRLAEAAAAVADRGSDTEPALARLREREKGNDVVLDAVL